MVPNATNATKPKGDEASHKRTTKGCAIEYYSEKEIERERESERAREREREKESQNEGEKER